MHELFRGVDAEDLESVSYTHLDVYKRQTQKLDEVVVVGYGVQKKVNMTGSISNVKADDLSVIPSTNPVSYTHLDVYKRQVYG